MRWLGICCLGWSVGFATDIAPRESDACSVVRSLTTSAEFPRRADQYIKHAIFTVTGEDFSWANICGPELLELTRSHMGTYPQLIEILVATATHSTRVNAGEEVMFANLIGLSDLCTERADAIRSRLLDTYVRSWSSRPRDPAITGSEQDWHWLWTAWAANLHAYCPSLLNSVPLKAVALAHKVYAYSILMLDSADKPLELVVSRASAPFDSMDVLNSSSGNIRAGIREVSFVDEDVAGSRAIRDWFAEVSRQLCHEHYGMLKLRMEAEPHYAQLAAVPVDPSENLYMYRSLGRFMALSIIEGIPVGLTLPVMFYARFFDMTLTLDDIRFDEPELHRELSHIAAMREDQLVSSGAAVTIFGETTAALPDNRNELIDTKVNALLDINSSEMMEAMKNGFFSVIPATIIFDLLTPAEFRSILVGAPSVDIDDMIAHTVLVGYTHASPQIHWLWTLLRSYDDVMRRLFVRFLTGNTQVPIGGFGRLDQELAIVRGPIDNTLFPSNGGDTYMLILPQYLDEATLGASITVAIQTQPGMDLA